MYRKNGLRSRRRLPSHAGRIALAGALDLQDLGAHVGQRSWCRTAPPCARSGPRPEARSERPGARPMRPCLADLPRHRPDEPGRRLREKRPVADLEILGVEAMIGDVSLLVRQRPPRDEVVDEALVPARRQGAASRRSSGRPRRPPPRRGRRGPRDSRSRSEARRERRAGRPSTGSRASVRRRSSAPPPPALVALDQSEALDRNAEAAGFPQILRSQQGGQPEYPAHAQLPG